MNRKNYKDIQKFDQKLMYIKDCDILRCYNHFKYRYDERVGKEMTYIDYWNAWVCFLRGFCIDIQGKYMYRIIGNYIKDNYLFKIVYVKVHLGIYVPLTIIKIEDQKQKIKLYREILKIKNLKIYLILFF